MRLSDLSGVKRWLSDHPTAQDRLWERDVLKVSEGEIQMFYARAGAAARRQAIEAIDALQAAIIAAKFKGELTELPEAIMLHELPVDPFMVDDLVVGLSKLRPARRQACLYALESKDSPEAIITLAWKDTRHGQLSSLCSEILASAARTRHFKLEYVFWEWATTEIAAPLLELRWSVESAFACSWEDLAERYRRMIKLNRGADSASFLELANLKRPGVL